MTPLRALLRTPDVPLFLAVALVGRLSYGTVGLALLLRVEEATGSYAVAGAALVAYGLAAALLAPLRGRLLDRAGPRRALPGLALAGASALVVLAVLPADVPDVALVALGGLAGSLAPPLGPVTRAVWAELADGPAALRAAYSLDTVAEEGLFTLGPLLVGGVVAVADPRAALLLTAGLLLTGSTGMALSPLCRGGRARAPVAGAVALRPLRSVPFRRLLVVLGGVGAGLGGVELAVVAHAGSAGTAGALLAVLSLGSALGGAVYGVRRWARGAEVHLPVLTGALALGLAGLAALIALGGVLLVAAALLLTGLAMAPLLVAAYTRADALSDPGSRTEAGTLVGTVGNLGNALGTGLAGLLVDAAGPSTALLGGAGLLTVTAAAAVRSARDPVTAP